MNVNWLNGLGDRNPQLLRELRSRFQMRSVGVTIALTLIAQLLLILLLGALLPYEGSGNIEFCLPPSLDTCATDWPKWWRKVFVVLTSFMPYVLYLPAVFLLTTNITQEVQQGTINFLRLSPRSSANIILGKLVGVPILVYLVGLLLLPLTIVAAVSGGVPLGLFISVYLMLGAWGGLLLLLVLALIMIGSRAQVSGAGTSPGAALALILTLIFIPLTRYWNTLTVWRLWDFQQLNFYNALPNALPIDWFSLPINSQPLIAHGFLVGNIGLIVYWFWRVGQRLFQKPTATAISKRQSYAMVAYLSLLTIGFMFGWGAPAGELFAGLTVLASMVMYAALLLIGALSTPRQMVFDWLRSRREVMLVQRAQNRSPGQRRANQIRAWLFGEKSLGVTAIWVNWLIVYVALSLLLPWLGAFTPYAILGLVLTTLLVANYSLLIQIMLLLETPKRQTWALGSLVVAVILPMVASFIPGLDWIAPYLSPLIWWPIGSLARSTEFVFSSAEMMFYGALVALTIQGTVLVAQVLLLRSRLKHLSRGL
ncbi:ABC transporter permease [filamentous cyanobacterium LEGE 11480]|uniref:ABC transporter permease n=1 Tax=Romeriopsis navalis LEGE 11480 TaxID=2777977 RepID=A0A928Z2Y8_9CYAN|nr:ABC transporter permease [Romeriopsis navalis]MBE9030916.1 ABC transporter permease [Romeriopsis navalis LEGE 11480]